MPKTPPKSDNNTPGPTTPPTATTATNQNQSVNKDLDSREYGAGADSPDNLILSVFIKAYLSTINKGKPYAGEKRTRKVYEEMSRRKKNKEEKTFHCKLVTNKKKSISYTKILLNNWEANGKRPNRKNLRGTWTSKKFAEDFSLVAPQLVSASHLEIILNVFRGLQKNCHTTTKKRKKKKRKKSAKVPALA